MRKQDQVLQVLRESNGRIFGATFVKKDGTERKINARLNVKKGVTGKGMSYDPLDYGLLPVFDMQKGEFRSINLRTTKEATVNGQTYKF